MTDINKQIEEEAREYSYSPKRSTGHYTDVQIEQYINDAYVDGANSIIDRFRWRKVSEELPDKSCEVLVKDSAACMYIAYFSYGKFILDRYTQINGDIREWKQID